MRVSLQVDLLRPETRKDVLQPVGDLRVRGELHLSLVLSKYRDRRRALMRSRSILAVFSWGVDRSETEIGLWRAETGG